MGFTESDICPFEGDPNVTCRSFVEPLHGVKGVQKQNYGGSGLNFIPHRVQVFSITDIGVSLNKVAAEAVIQRGNERAIFKQQANTSIAEVDPTPMNDVQQPGDSLLEKEDKATGDVIAPSKRFNLRHVSSGKYVQPIDSSKFKEGRVNGVEIILGPGPAPRPGIFCMSEGCLQHIESGLFVYPSLSLALNGAGLVLDDRPERPSAFQIDDSGYLVQLGSGLIVQPKNSGTSDVIELVLLPKGSACECDEEIAFQLETYPATN